jgi:hypothetical protein
MRRASPENTGGVTVNSCEVTVVKNIEVVITISVALASAIAGICVWSYSTFATKEQVQAVANMVDSNKKDILSLVESNKRDTNDVIRQIQLNAEKSAMQFSQAILETKHDLQSYSDKNKQSMDTGFSNLKEMFLDLKDEIRSGNIKTRRRPEN